MTPRDDEENPIIRDSTTGCWVSSLYNYFITRSIYARESTSFKEIRGAQ